MTAPVPVCTTCGEPHLATLGGFRLQACISHGSGISRPDRKGRPCRRLPVGGMTVCTAHGGAAPQTKRRAERRIMEQAATDLVNTFGVPVTDADPGTIILERIGTLAGHVRWLQARVEELQPDDVAWGTTTIKTGGQDAGTTEEAKPSVWVELYDRWGQQLQNLCIAALKVGLKEREVRIAEQQGAAICSLLDGLLLDLGIDPQLPATAEKVAKHLRLLS